MPVKDKEKSLAALCNEEQREVSLTASGRVAKKRTFFDAADGDAKHSPVQKKVKLPAAKTKKKSTPAKPKKVGKKSKTTKSKGVVKSSNLNKNSSNSKGEVNDKKDEKVSEPNDSRVNQETQRDVPMQHDAGIPEMDDPTVDSFFSDEGGSNDKPVKPKKSVSFSPQIKVFTIPSRRMINASLANSDSELDDDDEFEEDIAPPVPYKCVRFAETVSIYTPYYDSDDSSDSELDENENNIREADTSSDSGVADEQEAREVQPQPSIPIEQTLISAEDVLKMLQFMAKGLDYPILGSLVLEIENRITNLEDNNNNISLYEIIGSLKDFLSMSTMVTETPKQQQTSLSEFFLAIRCAYIGLRLPSTIQFEDFVSDTLKQCRQSDAKANLQDIRAVFEIILSMIN